MTTAMIMATTRAAMPLIKYCHHRAEVPRSDRSGAS